MLSILDKIQFGKYFIFSPQGRGLIVEGNHQNEDYFNLRVTGRIGGRPDEENSRIHELIRLFWQNHSETML